MEDLLNSLTADLDKTKVHEDALSSLSSLLIETAPVIILMLSPKGKILHFNRFMEKLTGYSLKEVVGADWFDTFIPESQREETKKLFFTAVDNINTYANQDYILTKDGTKKTVEWYDKTVKNSDGNTVGLLCIGLDITERIKEEKQLNLFRTLIDYSIDAIEIIDPDTYHFLDVNETACKELGYSKEEMLSMSVLDIDPKMDADAFKESKIQLQKEKKLRFEGIHRRKDGSTFPVEVNSRLVELDKPYALSIVRDVTERERTEQSLRDSEEKFHSIMSSAQDAIVMIDDEGKVTLWNEAAENIFGYSQEEAIGKILHEFIAPKRFLEAHHKGFEHFKKTGEGAAVGKTVELSALRKDGREFPIELSLSKAIINDKYHAIGILRDISERKKMQDDIKLKDEMMIAQSKQAAMSDMIAMLAHQWRQPISVISMAVNNLQASVELGDEITPELLKEHIETLHQQITELDNYIGNFRDFFKQKEEKEEITTIEDILSSTLNIIDKSLENNDIKLNINSKNDISFIVNKGSLVQVLLSILGNAKNILVNQNIADPTINLNVSSTDDSVVISVCDNGGGIPDSIIDKIDQPYFSTKDEFNGKGLGLYISRTIVERHLFGTLTWHNEQDGACFVITLQNKQAVK
jgi:PAS domain S-box-containing protein